MCSSMSGNARESSTPIQKSSHFDTQPLLKCHVADFVSAVRINRLQTKVLVQGQLQVEWFMFHFACGFLTVCLS